MKPKVNIIFSAFFFTVVHKRNDSVTGGVMSPPEGQKRRMVALYDYDPHELSPNVDAEVKMHHKLYSDTKRTNFQRVCHIQMKS